jgi:GT2 family glycosyltransferase
MGTALEEGHDYYLWLNDDTRLFPHALENLLATHGTLTGAGWGPCIVVGSLSDPETGKLTYGGVEARSWWRPLHFTRIEPGKKPRRCQTFNGNCVLIPRDTAVRVGNIDGAFIHAMGDNDYGLRANRAGCSTWIAPGLVGTCSRNPMAGSWMDRSLPLRVRLGKTAHPKGLPPGPWRVFARKYGGRLWPIYWLSPYVKLFLTHYLHGKKRWSTE